MGTLTSISSNILKFVDDTMLFKELIDATDCSMLQFGDLDKLVSGREVANGILCKQMQGYACRKTEG